jgi:plastocyanin
VSARLALPLAALLLLPVLAAAETHEVRIEGMQFTPATLAVKKGDKVVWRNADLVPHTATAAGHFDSRTIAAGASWSYVARKPGRYGYVCTLHPGMKATLVVQ